MKVVASLDFVEEDGSRVPLEFCEPNIVLQADCIGEVEAVLRSAQEHADAGAWVVGMVCYEAAPAFDAALRVRGDCPLPLAWFGVFDKALPARTKTAHQTLELQPEFDLDWPQYDKSVQKIRRAIERGEVYQVNFAVRLHAHFDACAQRLYRQLQSGPAAGYCAYLDLGRHKIVSASPELFFRRDGGRLTTRPMKGTRPRGRHPAEDIAFGKSLTESPKDRAENLMIVDLLRNDLSRLARPHGVSVPKRFALERHPTVWQMTSTVTADMRSGLGLYDIFQALFPCGSVTGAPKVKAMELISELETTTRGIYCGAIGMLKPGGDAIFNVAIRTVTVDTEAAVASCGLGSGVIWDSTPESEYEEVMVKGKFLQRTNVPFGLIETLRLENGHAVRGDRHLARLAASARYFGFPIDIERWRGELVRAALAVPAGLARLRMHLDERGVLSINIENFPQCDATRPLSFALAKVPVSRQDIRLFHKTTVRDVHERAAAENPAVFDILMWNEEGELTEFTRGNIVLEIQGRTLTPALDSGLLDGCLRREWLEQGLVEEARLTKEDLGRAQRVWFLNSLRGPLEIWRSDVKALTE